MSSPRKRFAQVGTGGRAIMFQNAIIEGHPDTCELVGLCDLNEGRLKWTVEETRQKGVSVKGYSADQFDQMIREQKPDCIIVTTKDSLHDEYICRAMELGCDVITEKPMTTDATKCQRILDTQKRTGRKVTVTFNYRYAPPRTQIKELLMSGVIGDVLSVDFEWLLNTRHGADYFRRWHRNKENSGGLMVHKATHHFDLVNWWISSVPETVYANGKREFYTPRTADRYGLTNRGDRCQGCPEAPKCPFYVDLASTQGWRNLYYNNEKFDGYFRDRCVFSPDIDIEDTMNVIVRYQNNVTLSYALNAFTPWEGYMISFNGTRGRLEHRCQESVYISGDGTVPGTLKTGETWTRICPQWETAYDVDLWVGEGGHGGADPVMLRYIFDPENQPEDKYMRASDQRAGAWSILTGVAANRSMDTGLPVRIDELVTGLEAPEYPAMPDATGSIPIPDSAIRRK